MSHGIAITLPPSRPAPASNPVAEPARSAPIRDPRSSIIHPPPRAAFTLIEILVVITLIGILATLTLTIGGGIRERGKISQAKVELAILATALEAYKSRYGDYPQTGELESAGPNVTGLVSTANSEAALFNALTGVYDPKLDPLTNSSGDDVLGKVFIEGARFTFENFDEENDAVFPTTGGIAVANAFLDPWEQRYQYFYRDADDPSRWTHPGFVLYSAGADGVDAAPTTDGDPRYTLDANRDNIYAGRN